MLIFLILELNKNFIHGAYICLAILSSTQIANIRPFDYIESDFSAYILQLTRDLKVFQ